MGNAIIYRKSSLLRAELLEPSTPEITCLAKSLVPEITLVQAVFPSSNLE
jgi:hypothetical protein